MIAVPKYSTCMCQFSQKNEVHKSVQFGASKYEKLSVESRAATYRHALHALKFSDFKLKKAILSEH